MFIFAVTSRMASSWKLKQTKSLCPHTTTKWGVISSSPSATTQWDVVNIGVDDKNQSSRSFSIYLPPNFCSVHSEANKDIHDTSSPPPPPPLRIILAIHGYGGKPLQEIRKWQHVADSLNSVIIAPLGSETIENHNFGWNAIECCGDPVLNEIDDLDFVINGVMGVFLNEVKSSSTWKKKSAHVIATGFSNGGFFTSLLGITVNRPNWLVGIIPMAGYQYDENAYANVHRPLALFMHHGGRDSVVNPNGCCNENESNQRQSDSGSNCFFDIGVKQETCQSVHSVFHLWSHINGCSTDNYEGRSLKEENDVTESQCFEGNDCLEPTNFCMWPNEGHGWAHSFPGTEMMQPWMKNVFVRAETKSFKMNDKKEVIDTSQTHKSRHHHNVIGKSTFLSATLIMLGLIVISVVYVFLKRHIAIKTYQVKRKTSGDEQDEEMVVLNQDKEQKFVIL